MARKAGSRAKTAADEASAGSAKPKRASKSTVPSAQTLAPLPVETLVRLILEETGQNAPFRKRVSAAIAGMQGPEAVAALIDRRLAALEKARGFIDWQKRKAFAADLDATLSTILTDLGPRDAGMALERLIRFTACSGSVIERVEDAGGQVHGLFEQAASAAGSLAPALPPAEIARQAQSLAAQFDRDEYGIHQNLLESLVPFLDRDGLEALDASLIGRIGELPAAKAGKPAGVLDEHWETRLARRRLLTLRQALADQRGDVDAFIALEQEASAERPDLAAIAERLMAAGRNEEALDWIRRPAKSRVRVITRAELIGGDLGLSLQDHRGDAIEIRVLDALGRGGEAQALRWARFERSLDARALRDYLAKLPDFEDDEALERAFAHATSGKDPHGGLVFLIDWPNLDRAAKLVLARRDEWNGGYWEWLTPAAAALEHDHPVAASLLYRALLDDILGRARSPAYGHGARHLARLDALAPDLPPGRLEPDHESYRASLRKTHGRKAAFWAQVKG